MDLDLEVLGLTKVVLVLHGKETDFVESVGAVGDKFAKVNLHARREPKRRLG